MTTANYTLVLVSLRQGKSPKVVIKERGTKPQLEKSLEAKEARCRTCNLDIPDYRVLDEVALRRLTAKLQKEQAALTAERRSKGALKAAETKKRRGAASFILCPVCQAKSKVLYSEFGGLQTRQCRVGHTFQYDKWVADRPLLFANPYRGAK